MRYEHLTLDISTAALAELRQVMAPGMAAAFRGTPTPVVAELMNLFNEIEARLQRRDQDPTYCTHVAHADYGPFDSAEALRLRSLADEFT